MAIGDLLEICDVRFCAIGIPLGDVGRKLHADPAAATF